MLLKSFLIGSFAAVVTAESAVIDLIPSNFDKVVLESGKPTLVEFFAPWCGHCKTLAPVYEELALAFAHAKSKVQIAKVDADAERDIGQRYGVQGFPTLKWFDGDSGSPSDYSSGRDFESLSTFITEKTGVKPRKKMAAPSQVQMLTDESFSKTIGGDKNVLVAFTAPWCGHCKNLVPTWEKLAKDFENEANVVIAKVDAEAENSKATAKDQGVTSYPTIKFFRAGSTEAEAYSSGRQEQNLIEFLNKEAGTHRVAGGGLDALAGTIEPLDAIVAKYTGGANLEDATAEIKKAAEGIKEEAQLKYAQYYVRVFGKLSQRDNYVDKELSRLEGILAKGGMAPSKADEITAKTNVLRKFLQEAAEEVIGKDEL
ncbi:protein disulfide-isomerase erp38 [Zalerion maritima]|uniref:protein disulfide-isomerase n=1 Tax=Zalerion maritima TaxID=339359 RepID=A0AAD5RV92_9PEZI|nr:protein disulfide-isomerase erp38 [Zalerion maritima]